MNLPTKEIFNKLVREADEVIKNHGSMYKHLVPDDKWFDDNKVPIGLGPTQFERMQRLTQQNRTNLLRQQVVTGSTVAGYVSDIAKKFWQQEDYSSLIQTYPEPKYHELSEIQKNKIHDTTVVIKTRKINHIVEDVHYT